MNNGSGYIEMRDISKVFGDIWANKNINLSVHEGEIHSLLGENGAGKSTLMNMLSGIYAPDSGSIFISGNVVRFSSPGDSIAAGIGMIHQHFKLVEVMTGLENVLLGIDKTKLGKRRKTEAEIREIAASYELEVGLERPVCDMSVSEKQNLEILKVLFRGAKVLILDEPTAVLTPQETEKLFRIMRIMKERGCSVIFISHKMNEVMEISDRITVLRKGETIATLDKVDTNPRELTELMVGRPVDLSIHRLEKEPGEMVLKVEGLNAVDETGRMVLKDLNFEIRSGEIFSVAGIAGSGQRELCEALAGLYPVVSGRIDFKGEDLANKKPREFLARGVSMSFVPEDRLGMGLVASMDIVDNVLLKQYRKQPGLFVDRKKSAEKANEIVGKLEIQTPSIYHPIRNLSGGNIQKVLLGRELDFNPELLITAYPVRGLDINTCYKIYDLLNKEKEKGVAILFIAEDLDSLIGLSDRIMVLSNGEITGIVDPRTTTKEEIGLLMLGEKELKEGKND